MAEKKEGYSVTIAGPGHSFQRAINEAVANQIINLVMTGSAPAIPAIGNGSSGIGNAGHMGIQAQQKPGDTQTIKQFVAAKKPATQYERVACLAYYLSNYQDTPQFKTADITNANTSAAQPKIANPSQIVADTTKRYRFLSSAGQGSKQITPLGEAVVEALPDREAVKTALADSRPASKRKRASKKKTKK